jgi:hypothetical protein
MMPSTEDRLRAEAFVTVEYDENETICRAWLARHRPDLVRHAAVAEMQKRQHAEFKARHAIREAIDRGVSKDDERRAA